MFGSFFIGGFDCSSHRRSDGRRLDLLRSCGHEEHAVADYRLLVRYGIGAARDGLRWHLIETEPNHYDWSSFLPVLRAARDARVQVCWDLCHYGWPDHIDVWSGAFVDHFARFAVAAARLIAEETGEPPLLCPINEISYWAWAGGQVGLMNPCAHGRGGELKRQLARAAIAAIDAVRQEHLDARFLFAEPAIHVDGGHAPEEQRRAADEYRLSQFEAFDVISGRLAPELGGKPEYLDVVGVNFYPDNQWYLNGSTIPLGHHAYRAFSDMLIETYRRYRRPMIVAETGAEGRARPAWLHYVMGEVRAAIDSGVPVEGLCLYPIHESYGWANDRLCPVGLFSLPDAAGRRQIYEPQARELRAQQRDLPSRSAAAAELAENRVRAKGRSAMR